METIPISTIIRWVLFGALLAFIVVDKARYYFGRNGKKKDTNEALAKVLEDNRNSLNKIVNTSNGKYLDHDRKINLNTGNILRLEGKIDANTEQNRIDHAHMIKKLDRRRK